MPTCCEVRAPGGLIADFYSCDVECAEARLVSNWKSPHCVLIQSVYRRRFDSVIRVTAPPREAGGKRTHTALDTVRPGPARLRS